MTKEINLEAKAYRTMIGLKDQGYSFNSAVGDIIDNCLSPKVKTSDIKMLFDKNESGEFYLRILDNGIGMDSSELLEAMRYGSGDEDTYEKNDLGKFGMGMKTASTSQARCLTVLSKSKLTGRISGYKWDLDYVKETKKWSILELDKRDIKEILEQESIRFSEHYKRFHLSQSIVKLKSWTMVCWDNTETINRDYAKYTTPKGAENFYNRIVNELLHYTSRTFGRFIEGKLVNKINISINGLKLDYWDPFCNCEANTIADKTVEFEIGAKSGTIEPIKITRYILPAKEGKFAFSSREAWNKSFGSEGANDSQGFYIYRNNRLIDFGGWKARRKKDEHLKLARVCIDLTDNHDKLFELDVKKTRVIFPTELNEHFDDKVYAKYYKRAIDRYNSSNKKTPVQNSFRNKSSKLVHVSNELVETGAVRISEDSKGKKITVENKYGKITTDTVYKKLNQDFQIQSQSFGNEIDLWTIEPHPSKGFILILNEDHLFYSKIYKEASTIKTLSALADAFLFTFSFVELRCKSKENESLFNDMRLVVAEVLNKFINEKLL
jgi:hypothetical protein